MKETRFDKMDLISKLYEIQKIEKKLKWVEEFESRFFSKFILPKKHVSNCWIWTASINGEYGQFRIKRKTKKAHRLSYEFLRGAVPNSVYNEYGKRICVLHICNTPKCVNPYHLYLGSDQDNTNDKIKINNHTHGETHAAAKLTNEQVKQIRKLAKKGICQRILAEKFKVTRPHISKIINCKQRNI